MHYDMYVTDCIDSFVHWSERNAVRWRWGAWSIVVVSSLHSSRIHKSATIDRRIRILSAESESYGVNPIGDILSYEVAVVWPRTIEASARRRGWHSFAQQQAIGTYLSEIGRVA